MAFEINPSPRATHGSRQWPGRNEAHEHFTKLVEKGQSVMDGQLTNCRPLKIGIVGAGIAGLYIALMLDDLGIPGLSYDILEGSHRVGDKLNVPLVPFRYSGANTPEFFNGVLHIRDSQRSAEVDPFNFSVSRGGQVPDRCVYQEADGLLSEAIHPFTSALAKEFNTGFQLLLQYDHYTLRQYLFERNLDAATVAWIETMCSATGLVDYSLVDCVMDHFFFNYPAPNVKWYSVQNGSIGLIEAILSRVSHQPERNKRVEAIHYERSTDSVKVQVQGETSTRDYTALCNGIDLRELGLPPTQTEAIRSLHYDHSVKIAIKFSYPWWAVHGRIVHGGAGKTDLPVRVCVYPKVKPVDYAKPAVLLCSYTWSQDAVRMGALVAETSPEGEEQLVDLVLRNLAEMHGHCITLPELQRAYMTHKSYDWARDPFATGAFVLNGPSQFMNLYPALIQPAANGRFYIVGEGASLSHGWVSGSLDSAYHGVYKLLRRFQLDDYCDTLRARWGEGGLESLSRKKSEGDLMVARFPH
ncbi:l-amino acid oxidase protein [Penicillium malachiteum]|uniref:l-amino acid oxidase protein n=1 Tax=Penicillium malachiteum TaxID=1324776 RepID=UPI002547AF25|nr:l-amino acid oxidase protein [Penicillium malachiteum]KAJ5726007.1 l-amino acid oxidase protein [Penicillium malachiteum]